MIFELEPSVPPYKTPARLRRAGFATLVAPPMKACVQVYLQLTTRSEIRLLISKYGSFLKHAQESTIVLCTSVASWPRRNQSVLAFFLCIYGRTIAC